ncbi:transposase [Nonomuraea thailandensis]
MTSKTRWPTRSAQKPRCPSPRPRPSARPSSPSTTPGAAATGIELDYLFCDASHFNMHDGSRAEPILAAWGITAPSKPVFISPARRRLESTDAWHDFLTNLTARGLRPPLLLVSEAHPA